ncbi:uncharacterized protein LOC135463083 [Liolophura sinensis]|uniref:uncharacterized protein LOC135463083 n=1 Tax=Liolophura sinensis TaxID=3198878 RepID=UPI003158F737
MLDKEGFTPSHVAAPDNFVPFVRPLLENRVNINMQNKQLSYYGFPVTSPTSHADVIAVTSMAPNAAAPDYQALHGVQTTSFGCNSHSLTKPGRKKPSPSASMKKNGTLPKEGVKADGQKNGGMKLSSSSSMRKDGNLSETGANVDRQPAERQKTLPSVSKRKSGNLPKKGVKVDGQKTVRVTMLFI